MALTPRGRAIAALLAGGPSAVLSHTTGAALWVMRADALLRPEVTVPFERSRNRRTLRVHGSRRLPPDEVRILDGLPVTSPERTLIDLAEVVGRSETARALREARVRGLVDDESLAHALARHPARRGAATVRSLLASPVAELTRSGMERAFRALLRGAGLPQPIANHRVAGRERDFVWPAQRLIVETDAFSTHGDRASFERDRRRDQELIARGWRVLRFTYDQIRDEPMRVLATVAAALAL